MSKYILFTDGMIYEFNKESGLYHHVVNNHEEYINKCVHPNQINTVLIKKTSDSILDLIEIGDAVEIKNWGKMFVKTLYYDDFGALYVNDLYVYYDSFVYKQQLNGDYKRYEVERD